MIFSSKRNGLLRIRIHQALDRQQLELFVGDVFRIATAANFLFQRAGIAQPIAFGIVFAQFTDRRQRLGLVASLVKSVGLPVHCAVGFAAMDLYHFIELLDGVVVFAIVQRVLGGLIQLVFMRVGFLRGLAGPAVMPTGLAAPPAAEDSPKETTIFRNKIRNNLRFIIGYSLWFTLPPESSGRRTFEFTSELITRTLNKSPSDWMVWRTCSKSPGETSAGPLAISASTRPS